MDKLVVWPTEHPALTIALLLLVLFIGLNLLAYRHAWAMTHFQPAQQNPRRLNLWHERTEPLTFLERMQLAVSGVVVERPAEEARPEDLSLVPVPHSYPGGEGRLTAWHIPCEPSAGLVLLFHGYANDKARLLPEARAFHDLGYSCFLVDFRGCGDSDGQRTSIGYHEADDVASSVAYARQLWPSEPIILFGHSMGAAAVLRALSQLGVAADALVLECPFDRLLSTVQARFTTTGLPWFPAAPLMVFWGGRQHGFNGFRHNPVEYARRVTCPTLLLHGVCDNRVSCRQIQSVYRNLAGAKQLHHFEGLGHHSLVAEQPEAWIQHVGHFLKNRMPTTSPERQRRGE